MESYLVRRRPRSPGSFELRNPRNAGISRRLGLHRPMRSKNSNETFDLMVTDFRMEGMNGLGTCQQVHRRIRGSRDHRHRLRSNRWRHRMSTGVLPEGRALPRTSSTRSRFTSTGSHEEYRSPLSARPNRFSISPTGPPNGGPFRLTVYPVACSGSSSMPTTSASPRASTAPSLQCHTQGIVTSATLMANGPRLYPPTRSLMASILIVGSTDLGVRLSPRSRRPDWCTATRTRRRGVHSLSLLEPAQRTLAATSAFSKKTLRALPPRPAGSSWKDLIHMQIEIEASAQIALSPSSRHPAFLTSTRHKHTHMFPAVLEGVTARSRESTGSPRHTQSFRMLASPGLFAARHRRRNCYSARRKPPSFRTSLSFNRFRNLAETVRLRHYRRQPRSHRHRHPGMTSSTP